MKKVLLAGLFMAVALITSAQIVYNPGGGGGGGFTSPGTGVIVDAGGGSLAARTITAGDGTSVSNGNGAGGNPTVTVDSTVGRKGSGSAAYPTMNCGGGGDAIQFGDIWRSTSTGNIFVCRGPSANNWEPLEFNMLNGFRYHDEFLIYGQTSTPVGDLGLRYDANASGTVTANVTYDANHPGILRIQSHATNDNSGGQIGFTNGIANQNWNSVIINGNVLYQAIVRTASTGALTSSAIVFGFTANNASVDTSAGGIWIIYDTDRSHTTWTFQICNTAAGTGCQAAGDNTTSDTEPSTVTPGTNDWTKLSIMILQSGVGGLQTVYMWVDDETPKTFCSSGCTSTMANKPTGANANMIPFIQFLTRTTTEVKGLDIDLLDMAFYGPLTRY